MKSSSTSVIKDKCFFKMDEGVGYTILQSGYINNKQTHWCTTLIIRKWKTNPHWDAISHLLGWLESKSLTVTTIGKNVETLEHSYTDAKNIKWSNYFGQYFGSFSAN